MGMKPTKNEAIKACFKKDLWKHIPSSACLHFIHPDQCEIVGEITPQSRHACWLAGYAVWRNDFIDHCGKIYPAPPCE